MSLRTFALSILLLLSAATASAQTVSNSDAPPTPKLELHTARKVGYALLTSTLSLGATATLFVADQRAAGVAALVATPFMTAAAVQIVGSRHGGSGRFHAPLIGATLGLLGGLGLGAAIFDIAAQPGSLPGGALLFAVLCPPLGATIGAVMAHNESERRQSARRQLSVALVPTQRGLITGLQGRF